RVDGSASEHRRQGSGGRGAGARPAPAEERRKLLRIEDRIDRLEPHVEIAQRIRAGGERLFVVHEVPRRKAADAAQGVVQRACRPRAEPGVADWVSGDEAGVSEWTGGS